MYVVVFDTNILLSGLGWRGNPYRCLQLARAGIIGGLTCQQLLDELAATLQRKLNFSDLQVADTMADLLAFLRLVAITGKLRVVNTDPDDDKVIECALIGKATHIITGDRRHILPIGAYQGIRILSATDFLAMLYAR